MQKLRISIVQYLNTAPLVWGFTNGPLRGKYDLSFTVPSLCAEALRSGAADVAIIPAIEYQRIENLVILPDMAIASKNRVRSLLIVSKGPIEKVNSIALDSSSRSTQALTRILCARHWKISPQFFELLPDAGAMLQRADAALLIGDPALRLSVAIEGCATRGAAGEEICFSSAAGITRGTARAAAGLAPGLAASPSSCATSDQPLHVYDVVEEWRRLTGLPAVLAVWAARRDTVPAAALPELVADFQSSLAFGLSHVAEIAAESAGQLGLPAATLRTYLTDNIDYSVDAANLEGLKHYFALSAALGLIPRANPVHMVGQASLSHCHAKQ